MSIQTFKILTEYNNNPIMHFQYKTNGLYSYRQTMITYYVSILKHMIPAILLGVLVNKISDRIQKITELPALPMIFMQFLLGFVFLYIIETKLARYSSFDEEWQSTTPGLGFPALYFGVQTNLFNNIIATFGK